MPPAWSQFTQVGQWHTHTCMQRVTWGHTPSKHYRAVHVHKHRKEISLWHDLHQIWMLLDPREAILLLSEAAAPTTAGDPHGRALYPVLRHWCECEAVWDCTLLKVLVDAAGTWVLSWYLHGLPIFPEQHHDRNLIIEYLWVQTISTKMKDISNKLLEE